MTLKSTIASLAEQFASGVVQAIRAANLEEILAETRRGPGRPRATNAAKTGKGGRRVRRSTSDIEHVVGVVVAALSRANQGMRSEELQKALKLTKQEITKPIAAALAAKKITRKGQKRATTYFAK